MVEPKKPNVICDYCGRPAALGKRGEHTVWECAPCDAWVGVIKTSPDLKPAGRLANANLRHWKRRAHSAFDPLWRAAQDRQMRESNGAFKGGARGAAYRWLAAELGIDISQCHFGLFTVAQCQKVVEVCNKVTPPFMQREGV